MTYNIILNINDDDVKTLDLWLLSNPNIHMYNQTFSNTEEFINVIVNNVFNHLIEQYLQSATTYKNSIIVKMVNNSDDIKTQLADIYISQNDTSTTLLTDVSSDVLSSISNTLKNETKVSTNLLKKPIINN